MKRNAPLIIIIVLALAAISGFAGYVVATQKVGTQSSSSEQTHADHDHGMTMAMDGDTSSGSDSNAVATSSVTIRNFAFSPSTITVKAGTTVTWTNQDSIQHNVVGDNDKDLHGPLLAQGKSYSYSFAKAGTYIYHCQPHPYMKGTVIVTE